MSSSPNGSSAGSTTPTSDVVATSNTTATSGFTAVNGRRSPDGSDARLNGISGQFKVESAAATSPRTTAASEHASPMDDTALLASGSPGKRKRADVERREPSIEQGALSNPDKRRTPPHVWSTSPVQGMQRAANHQPAFPLPGADPKDGQAWYAARQQRAESPNSEARLVEALQRDNSQGLDTRHPRQEDAAVMEQIGGTPQHQITSTTETTAAGVQVDPKKRKRIFSNRTKTGCQTCRKRKKKCDEGKPECSNCTRGGFVCEGYTTKSQWQKPLHSKTTPVALQSKDSYGDTGGLLPRPPQDGFQLSSHSHSHGHGHGHGHGHMNPDGQRTRPIVVDEEHPRNSWGTSGWSETQTPTRDYLSQRTSSIGFQTGTPLPDPTRPQPSFESRMTAQDHHMGLTSHGQMLHHHVDNLPNEIGKRNEDLNALPQLRNQVGPSAMASTAQLALQHSQHMAAPSAAQPSGPPQTLRNGRPLTEKDKMTAQVPYAPNTDLLVQEREACSGATWRFNNSQNPSTGVSREERSRLFRQILEPQTGDVRRSANPLHTGHLGQGVVVEAPFNCSYGYNTKIGDKTSIGRNCTIHDPVLVSIGARCKIGPNVDIYAGEVVDEAGVDHGVNGLEVGKQVEIEDNVIIEGRCVIKAGVRIKTGSRILAGTVVDKNVPAHVIFGPTHNCEVIAGKWQHSR